MPAEDDSTLLPNPPPPRPAARTAAVALAMRRFDGVDEPVARPASTRAAWLQRPQTGFLVAASLVAVIGIPATLIGLRNSDFNPPAEKAVPARAAKPSPRREPTQQVPAAGALQITRSTEEPQTAPAVHRRDVPIPSGQERQEPAMDVAATPVVTPPPPPPAVAAAPPAAPMLADKSADAATDGLVVTGSRIEEATVQGLPKAARYRSDGDYAPCLARLQAAVRANDRGAVRGLIGLPLRVNTNRGSRTYRDAGAIRRDYDSIFTSKVSRAILKQRADQLFVRDLGAMIGDGEVWFSQTCADKKCSSMGPIRITAVNP